MSGTMLNFLSAHLIGCMTPCGERLHEFQPSLRQQLYAMQCCIVKPVSTHPPPAA